MRIGKSHQDVAIVLLGAFSRWVNNLDDDDIPKPRTKTILKALRSSKSSIFCSHILIDCNASGTNLKLAIDYGLAKSQSDLIASFMQTLIMSEGDKWIWGQVTNVSRALREGTSGKAVQTASSAVRRFATRELGKAHLIAALED